MRTSLSLLTLLLVSPLVSAQLVDVQPGRNFPVSVAAFGANHTEDVDLGDVDNDGDLEILVANGGNSGPQQNRIFINDGGLQIGVEGTFTEGTATRFVGLPADTSRDCVFADFDGDADLDIYIANRGNTVNGGEVSRAYINQGAQQLGTIGFYAEGTDAFWGSLVSVPLAKEVGVQDGQGPWRDFSCDCDFADLDDDGDVDLFHSSYGPNINGATDSRIFLNDGAGSFHELWPWANAGADTKIHTLDIDLCDFDGDYDIDVFASSRESQARVYRNNLSGGTWTADAFTDVTQSALINSGANQVGTSNYGADFADMDGDGDFDVWATSYAGFSNVALRNNGDMTFSKVTSWIKADPSADDNEPDFLDFDGDGDLDALVSGFSPGTNTVYTSGVAQGLTAAQGFFHRNEAMGAGDLAGWPEVPNASNGGTTLDTSVGDLDGDGDPDAVFANDNGQPNRSWENALGVPDTHAPTFHQVTVQGDKSDGSNTVIHGQVRDNSPYYAIDQYIVNLFYSVDGGDEACVEMTAMGGQQFRGVIPGEIDGEITYHVEARDRVGNTAASGSVTYTQTAAGPVLWENLGHGTPGANGVPYLQLLGTQVAASPITLALRHAPANAPFLVWLSFASAPLNVLGGTIYSHPLSVQALSTTDSGGMEYVTTSWPAGLPSGTNHYWQAIIQDTSSIHGLVLSQAVHGIQP